jgi:glycerate kinase
MHIVIAPNAFKNSLDANDVANAIAKGLHESKLDCGTTCFPIGDGGDGTATLIIQQQKGTIVTAEVHDALGRKISASFGLIDDNKTAVIELANVSGIKLLQQHELDPLHATTFGTGELIKHALDRNVNKIILCIGGSATVDGGTGILQALGIQFFDGRNNLLNDLPVSLQNLARIDTTNFDKRILHCELAILCDVANTLVGDEGAAAIFGPQKGASADDVLQLNAALKKFADISFEKTGIDISTIVYGGAAGGVAAGLLAYCNARLVNGIEYFLELTHFDEVLQNAAVVITGEGKIDEQTLQGKGPFGVAQKAKEKNIPVIGVAGSIPLEVNKSLQQYFDVLVSINNDVSDLNTAIKNTEQNLIRTGKMISDLVSMQKQSAKPGNE